MIRTLKECPNLSRVLADWFMEGFRAEAPKFDEEYSWLLSSIEASGPLPVTFIAFEADSPVGTARIFFDEMPDRPSYNPWFGYSYVIPSHRKRGIADRLYREREEYCLNHGITEAYLYTSTEEARFLRRGWQVIERRAWAGREVAVMKGTFSR